MAMENLPLLVAVGVVVALLYRFYRHHTAPSLNNVRGPPASSIVLGNVLDLMSEDGYDFHADLTHNYGKVVKINSILGGKHLYVLDHAAMETILIKEEPIFDMPDIFLAANHLMFGPCLVSTSGGRHRRARKIMNPVFSPHRLREILPILYQIAHKAANDMNNTLGSNPSYEFDMLAILGGLSLEFIGQGGLGHSFAASNTDAMHDMKELLQAAKRMIIPMQFLPFLMRVLPSKLRRTLIDYVPIRDLHVSRDLVDILESTSKGILAQKKWALSAGDAVVAEQIGQGKDITSLLMKAIDSTKNNDDKLTEEELLGQMNVIIFAGTDTTSTAMSRCLQELAMHPDIQDKLRDEITRASSHGDLDFDTLHSLPLLDAVCKETLRMYPPATTASRQARKDTILPLSEPMLGADGTYMNELYVPEGTTVHVGIKAANQDRRIWGPDATEWKPDRWFALPDSVVNSKIPGVAPKLMTFIGGPRGCIGFKFAEMSMRVLVTVLIKDFVFALSDKSIVWKLGVAESPTFAGKQALPMIVSSTRAA